MNHRRNFQRFRDLFRRKRAGVQRPFKRLQRQLGREPLEQRLLLAGDGLVANPYHNPYLKSDVNWDGRSTPIDALIVIDDLNQNGPRALLGTHLASASFAEGEAKPPNAIDVNGDGYASAFDALFLIDRLQLGEGESAVVEYILKVFDSTGTQEITGQKVRIGQEIQLQAFVDDARPDDEAKGVSSAYLDVLYDAGLVTPVGSIQHVAPYTDSARGNLNTPGVVDEAGGSFFTFDNEGPITPQLVWTLNFRADAPGLMTFVGEPTTDPNDPGDAGQSPFSDTVLFQFRGPNGILVPVSPSINADSMGSMAFQNAVINIVADVTAVDDEVTTPEDTAITIDVLSNDVFEFGDGKLLKNDFPRRTNNGTLTLDDGGTPSNRADDRVIYQPDSDFNTFVNDPADPATADTFTYTIDNGQGFESTATVTVHVRAVNDAPTLSAPPSATIAEDTPLVFDNGAIQVGDVDADEGGGLKLDLTVSNGTLLPSGFTPPGSSSIALQGTVSDINSRLNGLVYEPAEDFNGTDQLILALTDQGNTGTGGPLGQNATVTLTITAVNDPPENSVPATQTTDEETPLTLSAAEQNALSLADVDAGDNPVSVSLTVDPTNGGSLALVNAGGVLVTQPNAQTLALDGTIAAINAALAAGVVYTPAALFVGQDTLTMTSNDGGHTGSGGPGVDEDTVIIDVVPTVRPRALNDRPDDILEDSAPVMIDVMANDRPHEGFATTLEGFTQPSNGTVTRDDNGTPNDLTDDKLIYQPNGDYFGPDSFTYTINDTVPVESTDPVKGEDSTATVSLTIVPVNDAPSLTVPGPQEIDEDNPLDFAANAFSVSDIDAGDGELVVTLQATHGTISVGVGAPTVGSGTANVVVRGTVAQINASLGTVRYTPATDFAGSDVLQVTVDDQGNTGGQEGLTDSNSVTITVNPVNDPPVNLVPGNQEQFITNRDNLLSAATGNAIQVEDVDSGDANIEVTVSVDGGTLTVQNTSLVTVDANGSGQITLTGAVDLINQTLADGVAYLHSVEGTFTATVTTKDFGATGAGDPGVDTDQFTIEVINFVPSDIGGTVFADVNNNGVQDPSEDGLAGVTIILTGTSTLDDNATVTFETQTDRDGNYVFRDVKPGSYHLREIQPFGVRDGSDSFEAPVNVIDNDLGAVEIGIRGGVFSLNNDFAERGLDSQYVSMFHLLASSADPRFSSGVVFANEDGQSWHAFVGDAWDGYHSAVLRLQITVDVTTSTERVTGASITVIETATGQLMQTQVSVDTARLRFNQDHRVVGLIGRPEDFVWTNVATEGEGSMSSSDFAQGVDAVFGSGGV